MKFFQATITAFAFLQVKHVIASTNATGLTWGWSSYGGDATGIDLTNLVDISCGNAACVAIQDTTFYISSTPSLTLAPSTFPSMNPSPSLKPTVRVTEKQFYINM